MAGYDDVVGTDDVVLTPSDGVVPSWLDGVVPF